MVKKELREKIKGLKEIIDLWVKFNNLISDVQTNKAVTREQEDEFLNIKTLLARRQQVLKDSLLNLMNVLSQATTLNDMIKTPEIQAKKFYTDWHETYLRLNELLGRLESGKIGAEAPELVVKEKRRSHGCLYNFVFFIVLIVLAYICFRVYDREYDLKSKIKETVLWGKLLENVEKFKPIETIKENDQL